MTVCKKCGGTGEIRVPVTEHMGTVLYGSEQCDVCDGTGEEQTNEEWFCSLPTEEKAEWLSKHFHCGDCIFEKPMCGGEYDGCKSAFVEWLKGEHK